MNSNFYDDFPPDATGYVDHEYAAFGGDGNYYEGNMEDFGTDDDFYGYVGNNEEYDASYDAYQSHIPPLMPNAYNNPRAPPPVLPHHLQAVQRYKQQKAENEYLKLEHRREMEYQKAQAKKERDKKRAETRKKDLLELIKVKNPVAALYEWCQSQGDVRPTFDEKSTVTGSIPKPPPRGRGRGGPNVIPEGISRSWVIREWSCVTTVGIHKGVGTGSDKRKAKEASVLNLIENMVKYVTDPPPEEEESKYTPRPPKRSKKYHANINTKGVAGLQKEAGWMPAWDSSAPPDGSGKGVVRVDVQNPFNGAEGAWKAHKEASSRGGGDRGRGGRGGHSRGGRAITRQSIPVVQSTTSYSAIEQQWLAGYGQSDASTSERQSSHASAAKTEWRFGGELAGDLTSKPNAEYNQSNYTLHPAALPPPSMPR